MATLTPRVSENGPGVMSLVAQQFAALHRTLEPDVEQPHLGVAENVGGDQARRVVALFDQQYANCEARIASSISRSSDCAFKPGRAT